MTLPDRDAGAHFFRCDFQVHSPRDARWKGPRPSTEDERNVYAESFVAKCRELGLQSVAITDHHDLVYAPLIRAAARRETDPGGNTYPADQQLVVYPGIELTLGVPCQALLLLDADLEDDRLPMVLEALACTPHDAQAVKLPDVVVLEHLSSLQTLYETLDQRDWLKGRYIVLPNVTDGGHQTLMRSGMATKYKEMPCVGGYLDGSVEKIGVGNARKFAGDDPAWGNKAIAVFQTSDSRSSDFANLGKHSTWVKWARPTAEALRQACLGHQSRISQEAPDLPTVFISRLSVSNSKFLGPVDVAFNPQYNAVIGGRGTGKSTILDYLRWGLCDQAALAGDDELANPSVRRERLIANTLQTVGGQVEVHFTINEIPHIVRRNSATGVIQLKVGAEEFSKVREEHVRSLLPVHAYSQKQLSSVALRLDELTRFVTAPIQRALESIDETVVALSGQLRENYAKVQRARDLDIAISRHRLAERSLAEQAANLRGALTDLSEEDRQVLDAKPSYDQARETIEEEDRNLVVVRESGRRFAGLVESVVRELDMDVEAPPDLQEQFSARRETRQEILLGLQSTLTEALDQMEQLFADGDAHRRAEEGLVEAIRAYDSKYEEVKQRSTAQQAKLDELTQVELRRTEAAERLRQARDERSVLGDPSTLHAGLRTGLVAAFRERSQMLAEEAARLTELSGGLLRASMSQGKGLAAVDRRFRGLIQGSSVRSGRVDQLFGALKDESDPLGTWEEVLVELEELILLDEDAEHTSETTPVLSRLGFPLADQTRIRRPLSSDGWLDLALTPIRDEPVFEYQTKEAEFIPFSAASAGQQATALLRVLLSQAGMPLVIDQPEEDLDSQVIQDVVEQIWGAKRRRQVLFASHNANLVVNGDAELVVACDYRKAGDQSGGRISLQGAIDVPAVRIEITKVMEGGEKAFRLRKEKYGY